MIDKETELNMTDWELSEDYYKEREGKQELKLEDFMMGEDEIPSLVSGEETDPLLAQTISDVKNVLSVCQEGNDRTYMLYGHVHNSFDEVLVSRFIRETKEARRVNMYTRTEEPIPCNMLNCFCMYSDYEPLSLDEWIVLTQKRREALFRTE